MNTVKVYEICLAAVFTLIVNGLMIFLVVKLNVLVNLNSSNESKEDGIVMDFRKPPKKIKIELPNIVQSSIRHKMKVATKIQKINIPSSLPLGPQVSYKKRDEDIFGDIIRNSKEESKDLGFREGVDRKIYEPPREIGKVKLKYPRHAKENNIEGRVTLKIRLSDTGKIDQVWVIESIPSGVFDEVAKESLNKLKYLPAKFKGKSVPSYCIKRYYFSITK